MSDIDLEDGEIASERSGTSIQSRSGTGDLNDELVIDQYVQENGNITQSSVNPKDIVVTVTNENAQELDHRNVQQRQRRRSRTERNERRTTYSGPSSASKRQKPASYARKTGESPSSAWNANSNGGGGNIRQARQMRQPPPESTIFPPPNMHHGFGVPNMMAPPLFHQMPPGNPFQNRGPFDSFATLPPPQYYNPLRQHNHHSQDHGMHMQDISTEEGTFRPANYENVRMDIEDGRVTPEDALMTPGVVGPPPIQIPLHYTAPVILPPPPPPPPRLPLLPTPKPIATSTPFPVTDDEELESIRQDLLRAQAAKKRAAPESGGPMQNLAKKTKPTPSKNKELPPSKQKRVVSPIAEQKNAKPESPIIAPIKSSPTARSTAASSNTLLEASSVPSIPVPTATPPVAASVSPHPILHHAERSHTAHDPADLTGPSAEDRRKRIRERQKVLDDLIGTSQIQLREDSDEWRAVTIRCKELKKAMTESRDAIMKARVERRELQSQLDELDDVEIEILFDEEQLTLNRPLPKIMKIEHSKIQVSDQKTLVQETTSPEKKPETTVQPVKSPEKMEESSEEQSNSSQQQQIDQQKQPDLVPVATTSAIPAKTMVVTKQSANEDSDGDLIIERVVLTTKNAPVQTVAPILETVENEAEYEKTGSDADSTGDGDIGSEAEYDSDEDEEEAGDSVEDSRKASQNSLLSAVMSEGAGGTLASSGITAEQSLREKLLAAKRSRQSPETTVEVVSSSSVDQCEESRQLLLKLCKFDLNGRCTRGNECNFLHLHNFNNDARQRTLLEGILREVLDYQEADIEPGVKQVMSYMDHVKTFEALIHQFLGLVMNQNPSFRTRLFAFYANH